MIWRFQVRVVASPLFRHVARLPVRQVDAVRTDRQTNKRGGNRTYDKCCRTPGTDLVLTQPRTVGTDRHSNSRTQVITIPTKRLFQRRFAVKSTLSLYFTPTWGHPHYPIATKFGRGVELRYVITPAKFGLDR